MQAGTSPVWPRDWQSPLPKLAKISLAFLYLGSGFTALVYEVVWSRYLETILGSSTLSTSFIIASFLGGIALGSFFFGKISPSPAGAARIYGILEISIALLALCIPLWMKIIPSWIIPLWGKTLLALSPVIICAGLMGGTFPVLVLTIDNNSLEKQKWTSVFYGFNTLGAAAGTLSAGFFLIFSLGLLKTSCLMAVMNILIGLSALFLSKEFSIRQNNPEEPQLDTSDKPCFYRIGAVCLFLAGFSTILYEVVWTRLLTMVLSSSTYAFTTILFTFLIGMAIGSLFVSLWLKYSKNTVFWICFFQLFLCMSIAGTVYFQNRIPLLFYQRFKEISHSFTNISLLQFFISSLLLLTPACLIGASFPLLLKYSTESLTRPSRIGRLYAFNAMGNVLGALAASLVILPFLGIQKSIIAGISIHVCICLLLAFTSRISSWKKITYFVLAAGIFAASVLLPKWDLKILTSGLAVYASNYSVLGLDEKTLIDTFKRTKILFSKDGRTTHVTVRKFGGVKSLLINGKADGSDGHDIQTELLCAHFPLLLHPSPKDVFVIGLGTGITLRAVEKYNVESIDCVEIEKRVVEASRFFKKANHDSLKDTRLNLVVNDARFYLSQTHKSYDCVISEPSNPWLAGIGSLYTLEMFQLIHSKLRPGGIVCQWIHYYNMSGQDLKTVIRTFQKVFPHATLWAQPHLSDLLLIARKDQPLPESAIETNQFRIKKVRKDLSELQVANLGVLNAHQWLNSDELHAYAGQGSVNTDNHPILEFSAPRFLYQNTMAANLREILSFRGKRTLRFDRAMTHFIQAMIHYYEQDSAAYFERMLQAAKKAGEWKRLLSVLAESVYNEAKYLFEKNENETALNLLLRAAPLLPKEARIHYTIAFLLEQKGDIPKAVHYYEKAIEINPLLAEAQNNLGAVYLAAGDHEKAYDFFKKALEIKPFYLEAHLNLAHCLLSQKALEGAELEFKLCIQLSPKLSSAYNGLGVVHAIRKDYDQAILNFKKSLELNPGNAEALKNLERVIKKKRTSL